MWLVTGVDEEHRFRTWTEAVDYYRKMVGDWVAAHGGSIDVDDLQTGASHDAVFPDPDGHGTVRFRMGWETPRVGLDHFTAC